MAIYIPTVDGKYSSSRITMETALTLYDGALYKLIQEQIPTLKETVVHHQECAKETKNTLKRIEALGIKEKTND